MRTEAPRRKKTPPDVVERPSDGVAPDLEIRSCAAETGARPLMHDQLNDFGPATSLTIPGADNFQAPWQVPVADHGSPQVACGVALGRHFLEKLMTCSFRHCTPLF